MVHFVLRKNSKKYFSDGNPGLPSPGLVIPVPNSGLGTSKKIQNFFNSS